MFHNSNMVCKNRLHKTDTKKQVASVELHNMDTIYRDRVWCFSGVRHLRIIVLTILIFD